MIKYIRVYENVLQEHICKTLIEKFEVNQDQQVSTDLDGHRHFTEININQHKDWDTFVTGVYGNLRPYVAQYKKDCKLTDTKGPEE